MLGDSPLKLPLLFFGGYLSLAHHKVDYAKAEGREDVPLCHPTHHDSHPVHLFFCLQDEVGHVEGGDLPGYRSDCGGGRLLRLLLPEGHLADKGNESSALRCE